MRDMYIADVFYHSTVKVSRPWVYGLITDETYDQSSFVLRNGGEGLNGFYVHSSDLFTRFSEALV